MYSCLHGRLFDEIFLVTFLLENAAVKHNFMLRATLPTNTLSVIKTQLYEKNKPAYFM